MIFDIQYQMRWASAYEIINAAVSLGIIAIAFYFLSDSLTPILFYSITLGLFNSFYLIKTIEIINGKVSNIIKDFGFALITIISSLFIINEYNLYFKVHWYLIVLVFASWAVALIFFSIKFIQREVKIGSL